jgi:cytochrome c-type biogenesis protein CcmH
VSAFWFVAAAMLVAAVALLLAPLLRGAGADAGRAKKLAALQAALDAGVLEPAEYAAKRKALLASEPAPARAPVGLVVALALLLPLASVALYYAVGDPRALDPQALVRRDAGVPTDASGAPDLEKAAANLAAKMRENPGDAEGWVLLGRTYHALDKYAEARDAFANAWKLTPDDVDVKVEYAEVLALARDDKLIAGPPRQLIDEALAIQPDHQRALWLLGISEVQQNRYAEGAAAWEKLLPQLPADAPIRKTVLEQIAEARSRAGLPALDAGATPDAAGAGPAAPPTAVAAGAASAPANGAAGTELTVQIEIAPELEAKLAPSDVLFVFARAPAGPKMPLAIQRLPASSLPLTVTLTDGMGMMPSMNLSSVPEVVVGARVSKSGNAAPQSGDFEAISPPVSTKNPRGPVKLVIASVVP